MASDAKELLKLESFDVIADKGYTTGKQIHECSENNITTYCSPKAHSSQNNGLFDMQIFKYDEEKDIYTCPNNEILSTNGTIYNKANHKVKHYKNRQACKKCTIREQCTKNKNGRFIERSIYQKDLEENKKRVENNPEYYRQRQQIIEHQFGTLKRQWGFTYTLMKGLDNVLTEVNIMMIIYNLRRTMSILGIKALKNKLKQLIIKLYQYIRYFKAFLAIFIDNLFSINKIFFKIKLSQTRLF